VVKESKKVLREVQDLNLLVVGRWGGQLLCCTKFFLGNYSNNHLPLPESNHPIRYFIDLVVLAIGFTEGW